jgi:two-component system, NtrC family, response regulator AtoC
MPQTRILIVDDEKLVRWALTKKCAEFGYQTLEVENGEEAIRGLQSESVDLVLLDVHLPDQSGIQILEKLKQAGETRGIIMMTADPQLDDVKAALRLGAYDFVSKPINFEELKVTLQNALEAGALRSEVESLRDEVRRRAGYHEVIGVSRKITELMKFVRKVAASEATTILIQGESGTGKDLVAKAIHYQSSRAERPFVAINCSAIPETLMEAELFGHEKGAFTDAKAMKKGLFEIADGGTLFLDEIGELSPLLQAKLLRVLEDQVIRRVGGVRDIQVDVRVIAASNRDLDREVRESRFRQDLYYRLAIIAIYLPSLRERKEDIAPLVEFFLAHYNRKFRKSVQGLTEDTSRLLMNYDWPGNVRELKNALERAMILEEGKFLKPDDLPFSVASGRSGAVVGNGSQAAPVEAPPAGIVDPGGRDVARGHRARAGGIGAPTIARESDQSGQAAEHQP